MLKPWKAGALGVCHPLGTDGETEAQREEAAHSHTESGKVKTGPQAPQAPRALLSPSPPHYLPPSNNDGYVCTGGSCVNQETGGFLPAYKQQLEC